MTSAPQVPALRFETLEGAVAAMRERGLRLSTPRRLILEDLFGADGPVSAEYVARRLSLDVASVYRNLETMERHGLVRHVHLGHGPGLYVLVGRGEREHLYCEGCGAVRTVEPEQLDALREVIRAQFGFSVRFTHFPIVGLCAGCAAREADSESHLADPEHEHSHGDHVHSHPHPHAH
ncbi:MAG TPA: Fur family transcriptional regulator [Solirubrobacteraceae bacterium]|jgi:Fur family ferric uptake transcriptional regulator|nr:Fur family transcriptional regulator [Solirubrobacteraceae bacterium]